MFTKQNSWCDIVGKFCERNFDTVWVKDKYFFPSTEFDYVISYLSPWILPQAVLDKGIAINFHPGPPKYPGIGGYNFALYNGDESYGVVAHFMEEKVDTGMIFDTSDFAIFPNDTVETLKERSMSALLDLFYHVMQQILLDAKVYFTKEDTWKREPYTRKDLQNLCHYALELPDFWRWYNACYFPNAKDKPHIIDTENVKYYIIREDHYDQTQGLPGWQFSPQKHPWDTAYYESI